MAETIMTGQDIKRLRRRLGLSLAEMGRALGYAGERRTIARRLRRIEAGQIEPSDRALAAARQLASNKGDTIK